MKISSTFHPQASSTKFVVLDVKAGLKAFFAGLMIGRVENGEPHLSEIGSKCLDALVTAQELCSNNRTLSVVEVTRVEDAQARVLRAANLTPRHGAVAFVCSDNLVYDAVHAQLGIRAK